MGTFNEKLVLGVGEVVPRVMYEVGDSREFAPIGIAEGLKGEPTPPGLSLLRETGKTHVKLIDGAACEPALNGALCLLYQMAFSCWQVEQSQGDHFGFFLESSSLGFFAFTVDEIL